MIADFIVPLIAIGIAEFGDKTQLAIFCLSSKTKKYFQLLLGVMLAFIITDGIAVFVGGLLPNFIPVFYIKLIASIIFIILGIIMIINKEKNDQNTCEMKHPLMSGFFLIFVSEMGDKTQIASALFATKYDPLYVFLGSITALFILTVIAIFIGQVIAKKINPRLTSIIAGTFFVLIGVVTIITLIISQIKLLKVT